MSRFMKDWRNPVLLLAIIGVVLFAWLWQAKPTSNEAIPVASVGDETITVAQVNAELNARYGNATVVKMIESKLLEKLAEDQGVTVSKEEIDQLQQFEEDIREVQGGNLREEMTNNGVTMDTFRKDLRSRALHIKMLVTNDELKQAVEVMAKTPNTEYTLPTRYRIRIFTFADEASARRALISLAKKTDDGVSEAAAMSMDAGKAGKIQVYAPGLVEENPMLTGIVKKLKPGEASQPFLIPGQEKTGLRGVIQLVEVKPAMKPSLEKSGLLAGQYLLANNDQVALRARELEAKAISSFDVIFLSEQYDAAQKLFRDKKLRNQTIPGLGTAPATGGPIGPPAAMPAPTGQ